MAKYWVTLKCGHEEEFQLFGPYRTRERRIAWLKRNWVCRECYRKQKEEEERAKKSSEHEP